MLEKLHVQIQDLKLQLDNHAVYSSLNDIDDMKILMEHHVFAVWDFMSLLKALQINLTTTTLPWLPVQNAVTARFINEIVWGEESDVDENGHPASHFEMYLRAMEEIGADSSKIIQFIDGIQGMDQIITYIDGADLPSTVKKFLQFTFETINEGKTHKIAAAFTFGREDLIPDMFVQILNHTKNTKGLHYPKLSYYLERHIEVDGDDHGPLALEMIKSLCNDDEKKWVEVVLTARQALQMRIELWNGVERDIKSIRMLAS